uniref:Uncharacterized protein n=1 Tax=Micrurus spixii TaxID=129469 RepID=A0A2D4L8I9_9SAUR
MILCRIKLQKRCGLFLECEVKIVFSLKLIKQRSQSQMLQTVVKIEEILNKRYMENTQSGVENNYWGNTIVLSFNRWLNIKTVRLNSTKASIQSFFIGSQGILKYNSRLR